MKLLHKCKRCKMTSMMGVDEIKIMASAYNQSYATMHCLTCNSGNVLFLQKDQAQRMKNELEKYNSDGPSVT